MIYRLPDTVWLTVDALAVYRLSRLVTRDSLPLVKRPREALVRRGQRGHSLTWWAELVTCPWCVSMYLAPIVLGARAYAEVAWSPLALVLAGSAVAGLLSELG